MKRSFWSYFGRTAKPLIIFVFLSALYTPVNATPIDIFGEGEVTGIQQPSGIGPDHEVTHEFTRSDAVSWRFTYDDDLLSGNGVEILSSGLEIYLAGTEVDGYGVDIFGEIIVGSEVIDDFSFISLLFNDGDVTGLAFLSENFDAPVNIDGDMWYMDSFRIGTSSTPWYGYDDYNPEFQTFSTPVKWTMISHGDGGEPFVGGVLTVARPVPEPATMLLFGIGLGGLIGSKIRKKSICSASCKIT